MCQLRKPCMIINAEFDLMPNCDFSHSQVQIQSRITPQIITGKGNERH